MLNKRILKIINKKLYSLANKRVIQANLSLQPQESLYLEVEV